VSGDGGLLKLLFSGADLERQEVWQAVVYVGMAILLPILAGRELGRKRKTAMPTMAMDQPVTAK
jgi:hypothetical protein